MAQDRHGRNPVRLSASGACQRKLWYQKWHPGLSQGFGERMIDSFAIGDSVEQMIKFRLHEIYGEKYHGFVLVCKGCKAERKVYTPSCELCGSFAFTEIEQPTELAITLPDGEVVLVPGRPDGLLDCADGVTRILEIKTMANYAFGLIKGDGTTGKLGYDYACQQTSYLTAFGLEETIFIPIRKETGDVCFRTYRREPHLIKEIEARFARVIGSKPDKPLPRDFAPKMAKSPKGTLELGFPCGYCEFSGACYPTFQVEWREKKDYATGSSSSAPVSLDKSGRFNNPEEAQLWEPPFVAPVASDV
jgi:hypothetical protein